MDDLLSCMNTDEGFKPYAYQDSLGYWTVAFGKCIDKRAGCGLTREEGLYLLKNELALCKEQLEHFYWYTAMEPVRQEVLIELCYNIGLPKLLKFKDMIGFLQQHDYKSAATAMLCSEWHRQVGDTRANNMAQRLVTGSYA